MRVNLLQLVVHCFDDVFPVHVVVCYVCRFGRKDRKKVVDVQTWSPDSLRNDVNARAYTRAYSPGSFALLPSAFIAGNNLLSASGQSARLFHRHNSQGRCNDRFSRSHTRKAHSNEPYACGKQVLKRYRFRNKRTFGIVKCPRFALVRLPTTSCCLQ